MIQGRAHKRQIHRIFEIALVLKALHSLLEIAGGFILAAVSTGTLLKIAKFVTHDELIKDPNDLIANYLSGVLPGPDSYFQNDVYFYSGEAGGGIQLPLGGFLTAGVEAKNRGA